MAIPWSQIRKHRIVASAVFNPETGRTQCGRCERPLITGQRFCVCGAEIA